MVWSSNSDVCKIEQVFLEEKKENQEQRQRRRMSKGGTLKAIRLEDEIDPCSLTTEQFIDFAKGTGLTLRPSKAVGVKQIQHPLIVPHPATMSTQDASGIDRIIIQISEIESGITSGNQGKGKERIESGSNEDYSTRLDQLYKELSSFHSHPLYQIQSQRISDLKNVIQTGSSKMEVDS